MVCFKLISLIALLVISPAYHAVADSADWFKEISANVGIDFRHQDGRSGQRYFIETAASGGGWIDYDADGDLDLYLINGAATPGSEVTETPANKLYENRKGGFIDVTENAGVGDTGYGMGMCVGDYDSDGNLDFLVTNYGANRLYRNLGNGKFADQAESAGVVDPRWATGCAFADLDEDGDLDLYITHYVDFSFAQHRPCGSVLQSNQGYCRPLAYRGQIDALYINQGGGVFREEGKNRGIVQTREDRGFGVVLSDIDVDGDLDIYVANDGTENRLYINNGKGFFEDYGLLSGTALNKDGQAEAGMGIDIGDADGDGLMDIIVTHFSMETNTLYRNLGEQFFSDATHRFNLAKPSYLEVGWGVQFFDYDNDGDLDLALANGHVQDAIEQIEPRLSYRQRNQLFENRDNQSFHEISQQAGSAWMSNKVSRGLAVGDWNNDGRLDLLITNTNDSVDFLENSKPITNNHWLGVVLHGPAENRFAIGTYVILRAGDLMLVREVRSGGSFLSQSDLRLHFGLGDITGPVDIEIHWPDGQRQTERSQKLDYYWHVHYLNEKH